MERIPFAMEQDLVDNPPKIFRDVKYVLEGSVDSKIIKLLDNGGAKQLGYTGISVTHMIVGDDGAADIKLDEAKEVFEFPAVHQRWVAFCVKAGKFLTTNGFEYQRNDIFSNVRATLSRIKPNDLKLVWANLTYYGGHVQESLTRTTTHLITNETGSKKYEKASQIGVKIVCVDWITDSIKQKSHLDEVKYHPQLLICPPEALVPLARTTQATTEYVGQAKTTVAQSKLTATVTQAASNTSTATVRPQPYQSQSEILQVQLPGNPQQSQQILIQQKQSAGAEPAHMPLLVIPPQQQAQKTKPGAEVPTVQPPGQQDPSGATNVVIANQQQPNPQQKGGLSQGKRLQCHSIQVMQGPQPVHPPGLSFCQNANAVNQLKPILSSQQKAPKKVQEIGPSSGQQLQQGGHDVVIIHQGHQMNPPPPRPLHHNVSQHPDKPVPIPNQPGQVGHPWTEHQQSGIVRQIHNHPNIKQKWSQMNHEQRKLLLQKLAQRHRGEQLSKEMTPRPQQMNRQNAVLQKGQGQGQGHPQQELPGTQQLPVQPQTDLVQQEVPQASQSSGGEKPLGMQPQQRQQGSPVMVSQPTHTPLSQSANPQLQQSGQIPDHPVVVTNANQQQIIVQSQLPAQQEQQNQQQKILNASAHSPTQKFPPPSPVQPMQTMSPNAHSEIHDQQPQPTGTIVSAQQVEQVFTPQGTQQQRMENVHHAPVHHGDVPEQTEEEQQVRYPEQQIILQEHQQALPGQGQNPASPASVQQGQKVVIPQGRSPSPVSSGTANAARAGSLSQSPKTVAISPTRTLFYGYEPSFKPPPNGFLIGCVFWAAQSMEGLTWRQTILLYGGEVVCDYNPSRVTHVLCSNQKFSEFQQVLRDGKRLVTLHWLIDTCSRKVMAPPFYAMHLPTPFNEDNLPLKGQPFSMTGFEREDRERVVKMVKLLGAEYTPYFTKLNKGLVSCRTEGEKYVKAREWKLPVVNIQFLNELLLSNSSCLQMINSSKYQQLTLEQPFSFDINIAPHLMAAWKTPIPVCNEMVEKFKIGKRLLEQPEDDGDDEDVRIMEDEELQLYLLDVPSDGEAMNVTESDPKQNAENRLPPPIIMFTGFTGKFKALAKEKLTALGARVSTDVKDCTHLVSRNIATVKLYSALCRVKYIVGANWIRECLKAKRFVDEGNYTSNVTSFEKYHGVTIAEVLKKPERHLLFKGLTFFITPGVTGTTKQGLEKIIESGGGQCDKYQQSMAEVRARARRSPRNYIVIATLSDYEFFSEFFLYKHTKQLNVFTNLFIYNSIADQKLDFGPLPAKKTTSRSSS